MDQSNPYTREEIPLTVIERAKRLSKLLGLTDKDEYIDQEQVLLTREQLIKQKTIDIFSQMEQYGYGCNIDWFFELNMRTLKKLYRNLEDIWNYRLNLTNEIKSNISPPNGLVFNTSIYTIDSMNNTDDLREIVINEILKFNNAVNDEYKKLGYMYFLLGMGTVSRKCYEEHQWLMYAI